MYHTVRRGVIAETIPSGWSFVMSLLALIAACVLAAPYVHAATLGASVTGTPEPGNTLTAQGTYTLDGGEIFTSSNWSQVEGAPVGITTPDKLSDTGTHDTAVDLGSTSDYAAYLKEVLREPPITAADLPPEVELQPLGDEKGLQNRNQVVAINPMGLEKAEEVVLRFTVETSNGTFTKDVTVTTTGLPWVVNTGVRTVPLNVPVLLYAVENPNGYNWTISGPGSSSATLTDADTQTPWFTPDVTGTYNLTKTASMMCTAPTESIGIGCASDADCNYTDPPYSPDDPKPGLCDNTAVNLDVHAGRYHGAINPVATLDSVQNGDGRPVTDCQSSLCHATGSEADKFTTWRQTGHAEAFTQGITDPNTRTHFGENCFACHTVGFDRDDAGGIDDAPNYNDLLTLLATPSDDNWINVLTDAPDAARLTNIQCENCHGPNQTNAHPNLPDARVSLSADVCGSCHGEPARHGRFQQWQLSSHADYELARERGASNGNCARCHSGNGFVAWSDLDFDPAQDVTVTWDEDTVVPQVCAACHDPHDTGTTSGNDETNAKVRLMGDTKMLIAGFKANGVGKAATCMTCHNSRADGPRNDFTWSSLTDAQKDDTPHHGVQADLIMGQNAYFVSLGSGPHALIEDVCVDCHMDKTQPPDILSYQLQGTNHTFAANPGVCIECHDSGTPNAASVDAQITGLLDDLQVAMNNAWKRLMVANYPVTIGGDCGTADLSRKVDNQIDNVVWNYGRTVTLNITMKNGAVCNRVDLRDIAIGKVFNNPKKNMYLKDISLQPGNDVLWKANWNFGLIEEDSSAGKGARGVHNRGFSVQALTSAKAAVDAFNP